MSAWAVAQAAEASLAASESMEMPTAVKLTMLVLHLFPGLQRLCSAVKVPSLAV